MKDYYYFLPLLLAPFLFPDSILAANDDVLRVMTRYKSSVEGTESNLLMDTSTKGKGDGR